MRVRLRLVKSGEDLAGVSIHAPVRVRHYDAAADATSMEVSIHAPVRVRRPGGYGLSIKGAARGLRQPDAEAGYGQAR